VQLKSATEFATDRAISQGDFPKSATEIAKTDHATISTLTDMDRSKSPAQIFYPKSKSRKDDLLKSHTDRRAEKFL